MAGLHQKKLIYIFNGRFPTEKAHGIQIAKTCEAFMSAGVDVTLMVPYRRGIVSNDPVGYYGIRKTFKIVRVWGMDPAWLWSISNRVGFYLQSFTSCIGIAWRLLVLMRPGRNIIFYARDYPTLILLTMLSLRPIAEIHDYRSSKPRWVIRFILNRSKKVVLNSEGTKQELLKHYKVDKNKILIVPNGVDIQEFDIVESKNEARKKLNLPEDKFIIGYTGRLESAGQEKGVDILLKAFEILVERNPDSMLCVVGGPEHMIPKDKDRRAIFTGQVKHELIPLYLKAMDVVVIPLPRNQHALTTSPMKLFEFLAAGSVIIASDLRSLRTHLNNNNALFFEPENEEDLAAKIIKILGEPELRDRLSSQARMDSAQYSWDKRAGRILAFINHV